MIMCAVWRHLVLQLMEVLTFQGKINQIKEEKKKEDFNFIYFLRFLHYKRQNEQKLAQTEYDINSNLPESSIINNNQQLPTTRLQSMFKISNSETTSSTETSPFTIRKQQQPNSDLLNKMLEIAFKEPIQKVETTEATTTTTTSNSNKDTSKLLKKYRDLNTMVPDSL
jgi:hypothetical protein